MIDNQLQRCVNIADVRALARQRLPGPIFDFIEGGSEDEITKNRNVNAFHQYEFVPRILRNVEAVDASTHVLGCNISYPLVLAPTGLTRMYHPDGELAVARAASKAGVMYGLSTFSNFSLEDVARACPGPKLFQCYLLRDNGLNAETIQRAKQAGYDALCLTVDNVIPTVRERDLRAGLAPGRRPTFRTMLALARHPRWMLRQRKFFADQLPNIAGHMKSAEGTTGDTFLLDAVRRDITWRDAEYIRKMWSGPFAIKGVISPDDVKTAVEIGASAVIVCNHGGTSLDGLPASISMIQEIVEAVGDRIEVIQSGGIRRGTSIVKAKALGANAVMTGRPYLYGLAAAGEEGVTHVINLLRQEVERCLGLCGCSCMSELDASFIRSRICCAS